MSSEKFPMPQALEIWTADEVAECVDYEAHLPKDRATALYRFLWRVLGEAKGPTSLGGDGSNGTVETPDGRTDLRNDDKAGHWWHRLDSDWQEALTKAMA